MVFNTTFNNTSVISWRSVLLVEEIAKIHWLVASHWQTLPHNVVSSTPRLKLVNMSNWLLFYINLAAFQPGLTLEGDSGEEVALWRLISLSRWSKAKFKSPCNFEESLYVVARVFSPLRPMLPPMYFPHLSFMKMSISCTCLLKSIASVIKYFESDFLGK